MIIKVNRDTQFLSLITGSDEKKNMLKGLNKVGIEQNAYIFLAARRKDITDLFTWCTHCCCPALGRLCRVGNRSGPFASLLSTCCLPATPHFIGGDAVDVLD